MGETRFEQPYCAAEMLPHATMPDGLAAPVVCTLAPHGDGQGHGNEELGTYWDWPAGTCQAWRAGRAASP